MASPIDYAMMVLKQWEEGDIDWGYKPKPGGDFGPEGQFPNEEALRQLIMSRPDLQTAGDASSHLGDDVDWQRGPPQNGEQGPVLSAEQAMQQDKQRQQMAQIRQPNVGGGPATSALAASHTRTPAKWRNVNQQYQRPAPTE